MGDERPKRPGTGNRGKGRKRGSKNVLTGEMKQTVAEFFASCTSDNVRWRQTVRRIYDGVASAADLRYASALLPWSKLALDRTLGLPPRGVIEKPQRDPVIFLTRHGYLPFDTRVDPGRQKSIDMLAAKEAELALEAAGKLAPDGEVIDALKPNTGDDAEGLVSVDIPPLPETFDLHVRERDRAPGNERDRGRS